MTRQGWRDRRNLLITLLTGALMAGCAATVTTGAFPEVGRIESELQRGVSTRMDVQRLLGAPDGFGDSLLPGRPKQGSGWRYEDLKARDIWYYEDVEATGAQSTGEGVMRIDIRQQVLLIFFDEEKFDGFMWFTNTGAGEAW